MLSAARPTRVWHHQREIMITAFGILGMYLIVRGVVELRS